MSAPGSTADQLMRTVDDLEVTGRRILVRADLNVPMADGRITDDRRIRAALPTIQLLRDRGARVAVVSHLGRPKGRVVPELSLAPIAARLGELSGLAVKFATDVVGDSAHAACANVGQDEVALLENVRFDARETERDDAQRGALADELATLADGFVSDGFGVLHRKQASVYDLASRLPSAAGLLVASEVAVLRRLTRDPRRPFTVVLGGSKVSDKLGVITNLIPRVDRLVIGGGMAFTFLAALGCEVGTSLLEADRLDDVRGLLDQSAARGVEVLLPSDVVVADMFAADAVASVVAADGIPADQRGLDIGPVTREQFATAIESSATVFWNGPMGVFEFPAFAAGTQRVAEALTRVAGLTVVGGGDSAAAVRLLGFPDDAFGHISTGGGASLEFLEGKPLPGLEVLED
jgi:phosphoglycerate kinase